MLAEGKPGRLMLAHVPRARWVPAVVSSGKSQASREIPEPRALGHTVEPRARVSQGSPWDHVVPGSGFEERRSWDDGEQVRRDPSGNGDYLGPPHWPPAHQAVGTETLRNRAAPLHSPHASAKAASKARRWGTPKAGKGCVTSGVSSPPISAGCR